MNLIILGLNVLFFGLNLRNYMVSGNGLNLVGAAFAAFGIYSFI